MLGGHGVTALLDGGHQLFVTDWFGQDQIDPLGLEVLSVVLGPPTGNQDHRYPRVDLLGFLGNTPAIDPGIPKSVNTMSNSACSRSSMALSPS